MKINHFKIKDKLALKHKLQRPNVEEYQSQKKNHEEDLSTTLQSFLQSFQVIMNQFDISKIQKKNNENQITTQNISNNLSNQINISQIDPRDRYVVIDFEGSQTSQKYLEDLEIWVGKICRLILSTSFNCYKQGHMNYQQAKVFASQCFLRNICILVDNHKISTEDLKFIDKKMKHQMLPYIKSKYPMNTESTSNKDLQKIIKKIDNSEVLQNDFFHDTTVQFHYRDNGRYDDLIMQFLNEVNDKVNLVNKRQDDEKELTNYEDFQIFMIKIFQKSYNQSWVNSRIPNVEQNPTMTNQNNQKNIQNLQLKDSIQEDNLIHTKLKKAQQQPLKVQIENQKYKQKVQEYTSFTIGRKVQERGKLYNESQIQSGQMVIKNPKVLRLLTKWCDQLWQKFEKQNYYLQKTEAMRMIDSDQVNLPYLSIKNQLNDQIFEEKNNIIKFMEDLQQLNYKQQLMILKNQLQRKDHYLLQKYEKVTGKFACKAIKNIENLMVSYLNRLIHGLLSVSQKVYQKLLQDVSIWTNPPNLLSFKIGDLLRCKFSSKQLQTIRIFQEIERLSIQNPQKIKIYRIKNRLNVGTKDILINVRFNDSINCQIQLAVNETKSNFSKSSYNFNHYVYELQRSLFGPLSQTCTIWGNLENRSGQFTKMIEIQTSQKQQQMIEISACIKQNKPHVFRNYQKPFICSECSKHYCYNNYFISHISCRQCPFIKCAPCLIKQKILAKDKLFFLKDFKLCENYTFLKYRDDLPEYGIYIYIEKNNQNPILFKCIQYSSRKFLFTEANKKYSLIKTIQTKKQIKQFYDSCIVFQMKENVNNLYVDIPYKMAINEFIVPKQMKHLLNKQKDTLILSEVDIQQINFNCLENAKKQQLQAIKYIMFSSNKIKSLNVIPKQCSNLTFLNADMNQLKDFTRLTEFKQLDKLYISLNGLIQVPQEILQLKHLKQLNLIGNNIKSLSDNINQCQNMIILRIDQNKLQNLPSTFNDLQNLKFLYAKNNKFKEFPSILGFNTKLEIINLSGNSMENLPLIIEQLGSLKLLDLSQNSLRKLPEKMQKMTNLQNCRLQINCFQELGQIKYWKSIKKISVYWNLIYSLKFINSLEIYENIEELNVSRNYFTKIDTDMQKLINLKHLKMDKLKIKQFPKITNLEYLQSLSLNQCELESISEQIGNLKRLKRLFLNLNKITKFPVSLQNLINLKQLRMSDNLLCQIPKQLFKIRGLKILSLQRQKITIIPHQIYNLIKLQHLNLSQNQITQIPDSLGQLQSLIILRLNSNKITKVNRCIFNLSNLKQLNLSVNLLQDLDYNWSSFQKLKQLHLQKNKNKKYPTNLIDLYIRKCKSYFTTQQLQQADSDCFVPQYINNIEMTNTQLKKITYKKIDSKHTYHINIMIVKLCYNKLVEFPQFVFDFIKLECLNLEENQIKQIPDKFNRIPELKQLYLDKNLIVQLPESIGTCTKLQYLHIICETFRIFPVSMSNIKMKSIRLLGKNIQKMTNLDKVLTESLDYYNRNLSAFPNKIQQIQADTIILDRRNFTQIPQSIQKFKHLKNLQMNSFNLKNLPNCFKLMTSIKEINFSSNKIDELNIQFPSSLELFNIESNNINRFIVRVTQQLNLSVLNLDFNQIEQLPLNIGDLTSLTSLLLTQNKLKIIPSSIQKLVNLKILQLSQNQIEQLPHEIGGMISLETLDFSDNQVVQIPSSIQKLKKLTQLIGNKNKIQKLPEQLGNCSNIKGIQFIQNSITNVPSSIKNLKLLERLLLASNLITEIPSEIGFATNLTKIQIMKNKLTHLPLQITNLLNLLQLNISQNQIKQLPSQIGKLTKLIKLTAQSNQIKQIPQSIVHCKLVSYVNLGNCQISIIPKDIQRLERIKKKGLNLSGNPITSVECYEFVQLKGTPETLKLIEKWKEQQSQKNKISLAQVNNHTEQQIVDKQ